MGLFDLWSRWRPDRMIQFDPEYQKAHAFKNAFRPTKAPEQYEWVVDYAKYVLSQFQSAEKTLDEKAESVIKLFGGGTGLLTLGAIVNLPKISTPTLIVLGIAVLLALSAMFAAAWVRAPRQSFLPPSVAWALTYVQKYEAVSETKFIGQWHLACEGLRLSLRLKVKGVTLATWLGYWSIFAVALSLLTAIIWPVNRVEAVSGQFQKETQVATDPYNTISSTPDPSGAPQTPDPAVFLTPQAFEESGIDPNDAAEPQSIQFSFDDGDAPSPTSDS